MVRKATVREGDIGSDENIILDRDSVPDLYAGLYGHTTPYNGVILNKDTITNIAL